MAHINVVLENGTIIKVEGADSAQHVYERISPTEPAEVYRLVCKQGETIVGKFNDAKVIGYSVE